LKKYDELGSSEDSKFAKVAVNRNKTFTMYNENKKQNSIYTK